LIKWLIDWSRSGASRAPSTAKAAARQALPKPSRLKRRNTPAIVEEAWANDLEARIARSDAPSRRRDRLDRLAREAHRPVKVRSRPAAALDLREARD
jgi:hypothetical protein